LEIQRLTHGHEHHPILLAHRHQLMLARKLQGYLCHQGHIEFALGQLLPVGQSQLLPLGLQQRFLAEEALLHQHLFQA
jgi:hypothetical protein